MRTCNGCAGCNPTRPVDRRSRLTRRASRRRALDSAAAPSHARAFTLVETIIVLGLVSMLMVAGLGALYSMDLCSRRQADYNAGLAVVEAKIQDIRAATYNPPNANFATNTIYLTNSDSI